MHTNSGTITGYAEAPFTQLLLNSFSRVNKKMPCLLTNSWKPGISVSETVACYHNAMCSNCWYEGELEPFHIFLNVCNTTSEVCHLKAKEEPQQPRTYKLFLLLDLHKVSYLFSFSSVCRNVLL